MKVWFEVPLLVEALHTSYLDGVGLQILLLVQRKLLRVFELFIQRLSGDGGKGIQPRPP